MNNGNMWNRENPENRDTRSNQNYRSRDSRNQGNSQGNHQNHPAHTNRHNRIESANGSATAQLLEEIVQQNHTIIGLLRGIKNSLNSGEPYVTPHTPLSTAKSKVTSQPVVSEPVVTETVQPQVTQDTAVVPAQRQRKQFVKRFDNKAPLHLDELPAVQPTLPPEIENILYHEDENSVGESDPFALFGKHEA